MTTSTLPTDPSLNVHGWLERLRAPASGGALEPILNRVLSGEELSGQEASSLAACSTAALPALAACAAALRTRAKGRTVTFSPKVFIPLTKLCRDDCGYCTFRQSPSEAERLYLSLDEVKTIANAGRKAGCTEALFTLGERPELRYPEAQTWLSTHGYASTLDYLEDAARVVLDDIGLLPHLNAGTMSRRELARLKDVSVSMGVMLENASERLAGPGGPHEHAPSKWPAARLKTLDSAGVEAVPFTTGLLVGIGETRDEIIDSLLAIRELHRRYGHIQEVIVQNFRAKPSTAMETHADAGVEHMLWTVATARILLGPDMNLQVPPNLSAADYPMYLLAGINDWGGVSPVTIDHVNPEAPWPHLSSLRDETRALGFELKPRLPIYPEYVNDERFVSSGLREPIRSVSDASGYPKEGHVASS